MESALKQIPEKAHMALQQAIKEIVHLKEKERSYRNRVIIHEKIMWDRLLELNPNITNTEIVWKDVTIRRPTWR